MGIERLIGGGVLLAALLNPSYAEGQQSSQALQPKQSQTAPAGYYYCHNCGNYHVYKAQGNVQPNVQNNMSRRRGGRSNIADANSAGIGNIMGLIFMPFTDPLGSLRLSTENRASEEQKNVYGAGVVQPGVTPGVKLSPSAPLPNAPK